jgi:hypothetical protein
LDEEAKADEVKAAAAATHAPKPPHVKPPKATPIPEVEEEVEEVLPPKPAAAPKPPTANKPKPPKKTEE